MPSKPTLSKTAGIGLRLPHIAEVMATRPDVGWLEIHPENFLANPHALELLTGLAGQYRISIHTVGISIGSTSGINRRHLKRIRSLVEKLDPVFVSGHLAWSALGGEFLNDLLPLPFNEESLALVEAHIHEVQDGLGRPYLIENPASYVGFHSSTMSEGNFLSELVSRTGCGILCDVSNAYVSAFNMGYDAAAYIDSLPASAVAQLHLGGYSHEDDLLIDTHGAPIAERAWNLYRYALRTFGSKPVLIEWDNDLPPLSTLVSEAVRAEGIAASVSMKEEARFVRAS